MNKIGIVTYYNYYNFGSMLQALALQKAIEKLGYNVEMINCRSYSNDITGGLNLLMVRLKRLGVYILTLKRIYAFASNKDNMRRRCKHFDVFLSENIKLSHQRFNHYTELFGSGIDDIYDIVVTGSDQTFSPKIGLKPALFLDFVKDDKKKVAYAPSLGVTSLNEEEKKTIGDYLHHYKFVSCRESIGTTILQELTDKKVETVLDPTFLLTKEDWRKYAKPCDINKPFILCYFLGDRDYYRDYVKGLQKASGYDVFYIPVSWKDFNKKNNLLWETGPAEFLGLIDKAAIVCTDSYHGMCFSINFQKDFYGFTKIKGGITAGDNSRIYDLLNRTGLVSRFKTPKDEIEYSPIDYDYWDVKRLLAAEREISLTYLQKILQ